MPSCAESLSEGIGDVEFMKSTASKAGKEAEFMK
jgi:hypothetical protein